MADSVLPPALGAEFAIFETLSARLDALDPAGLFVYLVDIVAEPALYTLAEQFDALGDKGWTAATTTAERREVVKRSIALHRTMGTPYAVKEALRSIGFLLVDIAERVDHWTHFDVTASGPVSDAVTPAVAAGLIESFKNARSHLRNLSLTQTTAAPGAKPFGFAGNPVVAGFGVGMLSRSL